MYNEGYIQHTSLQCCRPGGMNKINKVATSVLGEGGKGGREIIPIDSKLALTNVLFNVALFAHTVFPR